MSKNTVVILVASGLIHGCAWTGGKDSVSSLLNPTAIHVSPDDNSAAAKAGQIPVENYYKAMALAKPNYEQDKATLKDATAITSYIDEGLGLVDSYCLRWFRRVEDVQRKVDFDEKNFNVIRQLGTALLGIGKASSNWVTGYGALNTAYSGVAENFNGALLTGPTTRKIKTRIFALIQQSAADLRAAGGLTFAQAYTRLERHADICTFSTISEILDTSLAQTRSEIDTTSGDISTNALESSFQRDDANMRLRSFWMPQGTVNKPNEAKLRAWMQQNSLGDVPITMLINARLFAAARQKAILDLSLQEVKP
jgi:hypothetical protein